MKVLKCTLPFLLFFACSPSSTVQEVSKYTIEQFYKNISVGGGSFSPDESKLLISSNESGIWNAYEINVESGETTMLTNSTQESYFAQTYFPNDNRFVFSFDDGGNENNKVYMMSSEGVAKDLTPGDSVRNGFWSWSRDEQSMFMTSNKRDPRFMDIYELAISSMDDENPISEMLYQNNDGLNVGAISSNKRYFALTQTLTSADSKMYLYDNETGKKKDISVHDGDAQYNPQYFSLDSRELYYTTDLDADFVYLAKINIESGEVEKVFEDSWDVRYA